MVKTENLDWSWQWSWVLTAVTLLIVLLYIRGWRHGRRQLLYSAHPALFTGSLTLLVLVWIFPLNILSNQLFSARVIQRILLTGLIPFLFLLSNGPLVLHAGLPASMQQQLTSLPEQHPRFYANLVGLTKPSLSWLLFVCCVWLWYDEKLHQLTLNYHWLHNIESILLLTTALLYWWHILAVSPQIHEPMHPVIRILYAMIGSGPVKIVGFVLLFSTQSIYNYPATLQIRGLNINDENLGGILIWLVGGIVFTWTAVYLAREWLSLEDEKPYLPHSHWSSGEAMLAPGIRKPTVTKDQ